MKLIKILDEHLAGLIGIMFTIMGITLIIVYLFR